MAAIEVEKDSVEKQEGALQPLLADAETGSVNGSKRVDEAHAIGHDANHDQPPYRFVILVTICIFMGYACLNALQRKIKLVFGIKDNADPRSIEFSTAVSFLYIGNLVFRLMHNVIFAPIRPRHRVYISFIGMATAMTIVGVGVFILEIKSMALIFVAYSIGGVAIGTFESNLLSVISPLGHATKTWAILGLPVGYNIVNVGSFVMFAFDPDERYLQFSVYVAVFVAVIIGALVYRFYIPDLPVKQNDQFLTNLKEFRSWAPKIKFNMFALMCDMFCVAMFSGIMLYIWDHPQVPLFGDHSSVIISHNSFIAVYNSLTFLGDTISRRVAYKYKPINPLFFLGLTATGAALCLSKVAILAWPGIFMILFGNGSIYANTTRHVDEHVMKGHNLVALSFWLFTGDIGSIAGANLLIRVKNWVGPVTCLLCDPKY